MREPPVSVDPEYPELALMPAHGPNMKGREFERFDSLAMRSKSQVESPIVGCASALHRDGREPTLYWSSYKGGCPMARIGIVEQRFLGALEQVQALTSAAGSELAVEAFVIAHGETDAGLRTDIDTYRDGLHAFHATLCAHVRRVVGTDVTPPMVCYQAARSVPGQIGTVQIAQLDPGAPIFCAGPVYWVTAADRSHATNASLRRVGIQLGFYLQHVLNGTPRQPLRIIGVEPTGRGLKVSYNRPIHLETDDQRINVSDLPGAGYLVDGRAPTIVQHDETSLDLQFAHRAKALTVAMHRTSGGSAGIGKDLGARAAVRSAEPYWIDHDGYALHDWACVEYHAL